MKIDWVLISRVFSSHAKKSGYHQLANWMPNAIVRCNRLDYTDHVFSYRLDKAYSYILSRAVGKNPSYDSESFRKEWGARKQLYNTDLLHYLYAEADVGFLPNILPNQKFVGTFHHVPDKLVEILKKKTVLKKLDGAIAVGSNQLPLLKSTGIKNVTYIPHGVDTDFWRPVQGDIRFNTAISVGSYFRDFDLMVEIADAIKRMNENFSLEIVLPKSKISQVRHSNSIKFLSNISDEELRYRYSTSAFHLLTMRDATANNALLESMACGCPIIASDLPSIVSYLDPSFSFACSPTSQKDWLDAAISLLATKKEIFRSYARQHAKNFDWRVVAERVMSFYRSVIG